MLHLLRYAGAVPCKTYEYQYHFNKYESIAHRIQRPSVISPLPVKPKEQPGRHIDDHKHRIDDHQDRQQHSRTHDTVTVIHMLQHLFKYIECYG